MSGAKANPVAGYNGASPDGWIKCTLISRIKIFTLLGSWQWRLDNLG